MSASKSRKVRADSAPEPTARPKSIVRESAAWARDEFGTSVDSDQLAARFLNEATEQGNFESLQNFPPELSLSEGPPGDGAIVGPNFDPDRTPWEQTVELAVEGYEGAASASMDVDLRSPRAADDADLIDEADDDDEEDETAIALGEREEIRSTRPAYIDKFDDDEAWRAAARTGRTL